jgi:uncharacterized membrane protein YkoI
MTEQELNEQVRQAFSHAAPDVIDAVLSDVREQKGRVITMHETKRRQPWVRLAGMAACLILLLSGAFGVQAYRADRTVDATVSLDVNPSVEIQVNRKERVLTVTPLNADGKIIVGDMDFSGSDLKVTVNALIGSMLQNGYLNELANSILISVDSGDPAQSAAMQQALSAQVDQLLRLDAFSGAVLSQTVTQSDSLRQLADTYGITVGKAQLIQQLLDRYPLHTFEELAPLSINELNLLLCSDKAADSTAAATAVSSLGTASDKAYIGYEQSKALALDHAGVSAADVSAWEIELDTEHGVMVYEVEFKAGGYKYEYEINASTGAVVKSEKEKTKDKSPVGAGTTGTAAGTTTGTGTASTGTGTAAGTSTASAGAVTSGITESRAREIALNHAGVSAADVSAWEIELDTEHGVTVYEVEFKAGGYEYEYDINASTGAVVKFEKERD